MTTDTTAEIHEPILIEDVEDPPEERDRPSHPAVPGGVALPEAQQRVTLLRTFVDLAARVAGTEFVPKSLRGKPAAVLACILTGSEMGIGPMQSLQHIHVVDGRPTQSAELMRAQIMRAGHRFSVREKTDERVTVYGQRADTGEELSITWTLADAKRAKLIKKDGAWETYPRAMLMARATAELARDLFADVLGGVSYTPEELGAEVVVNDGGYIDVTSAARDAGAGAVPDAADPTEAWERVEAMKPREVMEELRRRNLPAAGSVADLRASLVEAMTAGSDPPGEEAVPEAAETAPTSAESAPEAQDAPEPDAAPGEAQPPTGRPSSRAQAVKRAKAAVDTMTDERVHEMIVAYEHQPDEDPTHRRGQLIGLISDDELAGGSDTPADGAR